MSQHQPGADLHSLHADHPRHWRENLYVYPVVSRRSDGLSIGVNLNPDQACNFDCIYCQVDRTVPPKATAFPWAATKAALRSSNMRATGAHVSDEESKLRKVDPDRLRAELDATVRAAVTGVLFEGPPFERLPESARAIRDIAFSGDGEPTTSPLFPAVVQMAADVRRSFGLHATKIVLITDAACLAQPAVRDALAIMDANHGEIWAKLDAGTPEYYQQVNRPNVPFQRILDNILAAARARPIVIQSLWMNLHKQPPPETEIDAFARRLGDMIEGGGAIRLVQVYTTARAPAEPYVSPLSDDELEVIARRVRATVDVPVATYGA